MTIAAVSAVAAGAVTAGAYILTNPSPNPTGDVAYHSNATPDLLADTDWLPVNWSIYELDDGVYATKFFADVSMIRIDDGQSKVTLYLKDSDAWLSRYATSFSCFTLQEFMNPTSPPLFESLDAYRARLERMVVKSIACVYANGSQDAVEALNKWLADSTYYKKYLLRESTLGGVYGDSVIRWVFFPSSLVIPLQTFERDARYPANTTAAKLMPATRLASRVAITFGALFVPLFALGATRVHTPPLLNPSRPHCKPKNATPPLWGFGVSGAALFFFTGSFFRLGKKRSRRRRPIRRQAPQRRQRTSSPVRLQLQLRLQLRRQVRTGNGDWNSLYSQRCRTRG